MMEMMLDGKEVVFGLDIGTRSVVGTIGYKENDKFVVIAQEIREHQTRAMLDGQIHDINRVAGTISEIRNALEQKTGIVLTEVCIAAAGRVLKTINVHADLEFDNEHNVTQEDLSKLTSIGVEKAFLEFHKKNDSETNFYCVGYSIVKHYINDTWIGQPIHHKAKKVSVDMITTFLPDDVVDGLYSAVELTGLKIVNLTLEPIAAIRIAIPEKFRLLNIAMVDVGAGTSDISVTNDGTIIGFGMIPYAGDHMTEVLAKSCLIDFATAEKIKTASALTDKIVYEDVMGLEQTITSEEVLNICRPQLEKTSKLISDEIRRLNGGESPSAVFIVGGGGRITGFAESIASELGLDPRRVAVRGEEIMNDILFPEECLKDSTVVTPIGICLSSYDQNNNFIYVTFNGSKIKLYNNNKLTVSDAALQASFSKENLFPRRGEDLCYTVNGRIYSSKGEYGESARIFVNGEEVNINHSIKANDDIVMEEATVGKNAELRISSLPESKGQIRIAVNGSEISLPKLVEVNGRFISDNILISNGDEINVYTYYTYEQLLSYMDKEDAHILMMVNGNLADKDTVICDGDVIDTVEKPDKEVSNEVKINAEDAEKKETVTVFKNMIENAAFEEKIEEAKAEDSTRKMLVIINQRPVVLEGKEEYTFVDIFDYIDFDTKKMQGSGIVTTVNGQQAQYTQLLHVGDKIEVYWK